MKKKVLVILGVCGLTFNALAQKSERITDKDLTHPPTIYSIEQITAWVHEARDRIRPGMPVKIMSTADWSNYINFEHFVPFEADPHGQNNSTDHHYDYNWTQDTYASKGLPTAEVIETGEFNMWWNRCNFKKYSEDVCKQFIDLVIKHEGRHYDQWQEIALEVINQAEVVLINEDQNPQIPATLETLKKLSKEAEAIFLAKWTDVDHYRCREVEDYSLNILKAEMPIVFWEERIPYMKIYTDWCRQSRWAGDFAPHIARADQIIEWWNNYQQIQKKD
ncbi:MAG: hypothetical protein KDD48_02730 [Bdellovibrionales bacterium]|nr:hypothetical protein [Bdellovibrionales bacterium]